MKGVESVAEEDFEVATGVGRAVEVDGGFGAQEVERIELGLELDGAIGGGEFIGPVFVQAGLKRLDFGFAEEIAGEGDGAGEEGVGQEVGLVERDGGLGGGNHAEGPGFAPEVGQVFFEGFADAGDEEFLFEGGGVGGTGGGEGVGRDEGGGETIGRERVEEIGGGGLPAGNGETELEDLDAIGREIGGGREEGGGAIFGGCAQFGVGKGEPEAAGAGVLAGAEGGAEEGIALGTETGEGGGGVEIAERDDGFEPLGAGGVVEIGGEDAVEEFGTDSVVVVEETVGRGQTSEQKGRGKFATEVIAERDGEGGGGGAMVEVAKVEPEKEGLEGEGVAVIGRSEGDELIAEGIGERALADELANEPTPFETEIGGRAADVGEELELVGIGDEGAGEGIVAGEGKAAEEDAEERDIGEVEGLGEGGAEGGRGGIGGEFREGGGEVEGGGVVGVETVAIGDGGIVEQATGFGGVAVTEQGAGAALDQVGTGVGRQ